MPIKLDPEKDIYEATKILKGYLHEPGYNAIYPWSNEVLKKYYNYQDLTNKSALCVTASGDHCLHAVLAGAKYIDSFDINKLTNYYSMLKTAMIKTYDYETFLKQFEEGPSGMCLKKNVDLNEIYPLISYEVKLFWESILNSSYYKYGYLYKTDGYYSSIYENCDYLNENKFNELKKKLNKTIINYHDINIKYYDYDQELTTYDALFLSNIVEYAGKNILKCGKKLLNDNGVLYNYHCVTEPKKILVPNLDYEKCLITINNVDGTDSKCGVSIYRKK